MRRIAALGLLMGMLVLGCAQTENPLYVDPAGQDFSANPELLERILDSPHGYLRFINIPFSQEVCRRFSDSLDGAPQFNLHGDAHVEQYAVTDLGRGLTDFDDSSSGPAIVDLARLSVSLRLAAQMRGWQARTDEILARFFQGYREALENPEVEPPIPPLAERLTEEFEYDREEYFEWVETISDPVPPEEAEALIVALGPYVEVMLAESPELSSRFFEVVSVGFLRLGIGSALDRKYLVRIRGLSDDGADDLMLELKQVRDLTGIDCIQVSQGADPFRILIGQSRIAYQPYRLLGYVRFQGLMFWIHAWVDNYVEASIKETFESPEDLGDVAYDVGVQLGRGHPNQIGSPLDLQLRREELRLLERDEERIKATTQNLAAEVTEAWQRFRAAQE